jgi:hypothetical protein
MGGHGTQIGVGGHISTANFKTQLLRVRKEQEQHLALTNVSESINREIQRQSSHQNNQASA